MTKPSPFLAAALNCAIVGSLLAQTPPPRAKSPNLPTSPSSPTEDEVVRITTELVQIDAVVTDKDGNPVTDLQAEDFEILEDKKPQQITAFSYVSTDNKAISSPAEPPPLLVKNAPPLPLDPLRPEQVRRTIVFVIDDLGLSFPSFTAVRSGLKKFVDEQMQPGDLAAVVRTSGGSGALQRLTNDKQQLYAAIEKARWGGGDRNRAGVQLFAPRGPFPTPRDAGNRGSLDGTILSLKNIVSSLKVLPGRKSVLFFSDSFEIFQNPEDLSIGLKQASAPGDLPETDQSRPDDGIEYPGLLDRLAQASNEASAVIYPVHSIGLAYTGPTAAESSPTGNIISGDPGAQLVNGKWLTGMLDQRSTRLVRTQQALQDLARQTGGFAIINNNDLGKGIGRVMNDLQGYYLIGYRPAPATFEKQNNRAPYHNIRLRLKRPDLQVRSRKGFYGVPDDKQQPAAPHTVTQQLAAALESPFVASGVGLRLTALFGNVQQGSFGRTLLHIDARDLTFNEQPDGWHQADIAMLASSYGENGLVADYLSRYESIRARGKTYANLLRYGLNNYLLVPIKKPGPYQMRAAVRDMASERTGSAYQFLEVPDLKKGRLALSGILVNSAVLDLESLSEAGTVYNAAGDGANQVQPTIAVRRFQQRMLLEYRYLIYNARPAANNALPELIAQVRLFRDGQLITSQEDPAIDSSKLQLDPKRLSAKGSLRLGDDLAPGQYVLQIIVTDPHPKARGATASQWIDFELVK
ncbi:MAG TPA: VWA domain-containing protein [Pyrinomonadaceae bacterium]|nr:VWA domain-containing protein [Pyrinomonadaceae bacterium]